MIVSNQRKLESLVYKLTLEQEQIEKQIQSIEITISKLLDEGGDKINFDQHQIATEHCLQTFMSIKEYDQVLNRIIQDINDQVQESDLSNEQPNKNLNLAVNNFYNAISAIEFKLMIIQSTLSQLK